MQDTGTLCQIIASVGLRRQALPGLHTDKLPVVVRRPYHYCSKSSNGDTDPPIVPDGTQRDPGRAQALQDQAPISLK